MFKSLKNLASGEFYRDLGLLLLRVGIGVSMIAFHHGYDNLVGGPEVWEKIGKGMVDLFGLNIPPLFPGVAIVVIVLSYVAYVFIAYHRLGNFDVSPQGEASKTLRIGTEYKMVTYNVGFGAYEADYGFFMDGGTESWARSKEALDKNLKNIADTLSNENANVYFIQEVDFDSTRTYHVDERQYLTEKLTGKSYTFAQNYDSPFLFYPLYQPHGASKSGIMVYSDFEITAASRVELPVENGVIKILDLDRSYSKNRVRAENGKDLVLYTFHLSAYTSDGSIATEQLKILLDDIRSEYDKGNYCVAGGDFNKDLLGDDALFECRSGAEYNWAQTIPEETFDGYDIALFAPNNGVPSCRNADSAYNEFQYVITIDGFLSTPNVEITAAEVIDTGFAYSDHNPVRAKFKLL